MFKERYFNFFCFLSCFSVEKQDSLLVQEKFFLYSIKSARFSFCILYIERIFLWEGNVGINLMNERVCRIWCIEFPKHIFVGKNPFLYIALATVCVVSICCFIEENFWRLSYLSHRRSELERCFYLALTYKLSNSVTFNYKCVEFKF